MSHLNSHLHKRVTVLYKLPVRDLFEALTDVWKVLCLQKECLVVAYKCEGYAEQDLRTLVK